MMKVIKKYWWEIGIGIIFLVFLSWPKKQKEGGEISQSPIIPTIREDLYLPVDLPKANSVKWMISQNIELPTIKKITIQRQLIDSEREIKIKKILGINNENGYVDKENNVVAYTEEIKNIKQLPTSGDFDIESLKNKLRKIIEDINEINNLEIIWTEIKYQKILYPRWIEATKKEAQSVEIRGDYVINGRRITTYYGESIRGIFNKEGRLIKISLSLKPKILSEDGNEELINIDEVSKSPINIYGVVNNAGIEVIEKVSIDDAEIVEVYSNKRNIIKPYYWLSGSSNNQGKSSKVSLIVKAEK